MNDPMMVEEGSFNDNLMVFGMPRMITLLQNY